MSETCEQAAASRVPECRRGLGQPRPSTARCSSPRGEMCLIGDASHGRYAKAALSQAIGNILRVTAALGRRESAPLKAVKELSWVW